MTRTIIWRQRRKKEIRSKVRAALIYMCFVAIGVGFIFAKGIEVYGDNADTNLSEDIIAICESVGDEYGICPELLEAIIEAESNGNQYDISEHGAVGLMQIKPEYTAYTLEELLGAETNITAGASIIMEYAEEYDDLYVVLTAYRYGAFSDEFRKAESAEDVRDYCRYARKIVKRTEELERLHDK